MKKLALTAGGLLFISALVAVSVWAFRQVLILENGAGPGNSDTIFLYRVIQYGFTGLLGLMLVGLLYSYGRQRRNSVTPVEDGAAQGMRTMGWKAWTAVLLVLGGLFGGAMYYFGGDRVRSSEEVVFTIRDREGHVVFEGTREEVRRFMANRASPSSPSGE